MFLHFICGQEETPDNISENRQVHYNREIRVTKVNSHQRKEVKFSDTVLEVPSKRPPMQLRKPDYINPPAYPGH